MNGVDAAPRPLRIALVNIIYPTPERPTTVGGAERSVKELAEALAAAGHAVMVVHGVPPDEPRFTGMSRGVAVTGVPIHNAYWPFDGVGRSSLDKLVWHLRDGHAPEHPEVSAALEAFAPDVVHTNNLSGLSSVVWRSARRQGAAIVHTLRDYYLLCPRSMRFRNGRRCTTSCVDCRLLTRQRREDTGCVDAVVGNSLATLDIHLAEGLFPNAGWTGAVHNISPRRVDVAPAAATGPGVVFGFIGRVTPEKGVDQLARAFANMPKGARLVMAGEADPEVRARLATLAAPHAITFLGFVTPDEFYAHVDVVVAPSLWDEPLPRSILEAFAFGRPAVGSTRGGIPEALGDGGWLFDPDDPGALEAVMRAVIKNPAEVARKAQIAAAASARFAPEAVIPRYVEVYRRAVEIAQARRD